MKNFKIFFATLLGITLLLGSCADPCKDVNCNDGVCLDGLCECDEGYTGTDCSTSIPLLNGTEVTLTASLTAPLTGNMEVNIEDQFNQGAGSGTSVATIGDGLEYDNYAYDLFDIDITESSMTFTQVGDGTTIWGTIVDAPLFPLTFVKFNFAMDKSFRVSQYTLVDNTTGETIPTSSVNVFLDNTNNIITVELSEGFPMGMGDLFTLNLQ